MSQFNISQDTSVMESENLEDTQNHAETEKEVDDRFLNVRERTKT